MENKSCSPNKENIVGHKTEVVLIFVRHSQKESGQVFSEGALTMSTSSISSAGTERAKKFGAEVIGQRNIKKGYATEADRTLETLQAAYLAVGLNAQILQKGGNTEAFFAFPESSESGDIAQRYKKIYEENKARHMAEMFMGKEFNQLTPDQQEIVSELAEEPAVEWYLNEMIPDKSTRSIREQAAAVSWKINRLINLTDLMPDGNSIELVSCGHKTSTESFLKFALGFNSMSEIGGSLKILDSWELKVVNDSFGVKTTTITIRRENGMTNEYPVKTDVIKTLAKEYLESNNFQTKTIDK